MRVPKLGVSVSSESEAIQGGGSASVLWGCSVLVLKVSSALDHWVAKQTLQFHQKELGIPQIVICAQLTNGNKP